MANLEEVLAYFTQIPNENWLPCARAAERESADGVVREIRTNMGLITIQIEFVDKGVEFICMVAFEDMMTHPSAEGAVDVLRLLPLVLNTMSAPVCLRWFSVEDPDKGATQIAGVYLWYMDEAIRVSAESDAFGLTFRYIANEIRAYAEMVLSAMTSYAIGAESIKTIAMEDALHKAMDLFETQGNA